MQESDQVTAITKISRRGWLIWGIGALFTLYQFLLQSSTSVMEPCLIKAFHIDAVQFGLLSSAFFYAYLILQIPGGILLDRYGARRVLSVGITLCVITTVWFGMAHSFAAAEASRIIMGLATAPAVAAAMYLGCNWFPANRFALIAGMTEMLGMLGGAIGQVFIAQCVGSIGWRNTMYAIAAVGVIFLILVITIVRDRPTEFSNLKTRAKADPVWQSLWVVIKLPQAWLNGCVAGLLFALIAAFASLWSVPYLMAYYKLGLNTAAFASSMIFFGAVVGNPLAGWLSDYIGKRKPVMWLGTSGLLITFIIMLFTPKIPLVLMITILFLQGLCAACYVIPFAVVSDITPVKVRGTAMGFVNMMVILIGAPFLQPLIGYLLEADNYHALSLHAQNLFSVHDYKMALLVFPLCFLLALILLLFVKETRIEHNVDMLVATEA